MSKLIKTISNLEIINLVDWYNSLKDHLNDLSIQTRWILKKNIKKIELQAKSFYDFRQSLIDELNNKYFSNDEKSLEIEVNGERARQVKPEYKPLYDKDVQLINTKINDILQLTELIEFDLIDLDAEFGHMKPDAQMSDKSMLMLMFYSEGA